jgi:2-polyprenyl-6-hydroxyphenyl methylase/3-demethylubiquinone-9 3-methyltransferase
LTRRADPAPPLQSARHITPGQLARRILGPYFRPVGNLYRSIFVDISKVATAIASAIPDDAKCLDIGGGDGMIANTLLERRTDISITMIDLASSIGSFVDKKFSERITVLPETPVGEFAKQTGKFDAVIMADVLHHIPAGTRAQFFADLRSQMANSDCALLIIKDIEPNSLRGLLSVLSDKYITGDRHVSLISSSELREIVNDCFGQENITKFDVELPDYPNYCAVIQLCEKLRNS